MIKVDIVWLPQAERDIGPLSAKIQEEIFRKVDFLETFPLMGPAMLGAFTGFRSLLSGSYLIIYRYKQTGRLEISRIVHGRRQRYLRIIPGEKD